MSPSSNEVQAEILKAARKGQEVIGHAIKTSAGKMRSVTPQLHELHLPLANKLPKPDQVAGNVRGIAARLPKPEQLARKLPKPGEVAGNVRGMAARLPKRDELTGNARNIAAHLPKPEQLASSAASLAGKLLANQRKFADQVLRVTTPQLPGKSHSATNGEAQNGAAQAATPSEDGKATGSRRSTVKGSGAKESTTKGRAAKDSTAKDSTGKDSTGKDKDSKSE